MGHNNVVSGHLKSIRILLVDGLSMGPPDLGCHSMVSDLRFAITQGLMGIALISNRA